MAAPASLRPASSVRVALVAALPLLPGMLAIAAEPVDFVRQVKPILESACVRCHYDEEQEGELRLDTRAFAIAGGDSGSSLVPGKPEESLLLELSTLPEDDPDVMPPKDPPLDRTQLAVLERWIAEGAAWPETEVLKPVQRVDFAKHIQPIVELDCVGCHNPDKFEGELDIRTREAAFTTGESGPSILPFRPEDSSFYTLTTLDPEDADLMPPKRNGGPLARQSIDLLRMWIEQGAVWPEGIVLEQRERAAPTRPPSPDSLDLVRKIHAFIVETSREISDEEMKPYENVVPRSKATYCMVPIPGGTFVPGEPDAGTPVVTISPFWMGKTEVTWNEYDPFMITTVDRYKDGAKKNPEPTDTIVDAVSMPTTPYVEMSFGMGQDDFPAISMTQHAANKYCQWLSAQTGHFYRLPTEAEWEYACRAGTDTVFSFGDETGELGEYAWYFENSNGKYQKVGTKKPNPWGLHDMHGNVAEWTLDQYDPDFPEEVSPDSAINPWNRPVTLYPRSVRGGGWDDDPEMLASRFRLPSSEVWKQKDPQLPKSIWYHTDAQWLGFRLVRPLKIPSPEEMFEFWNMGRPAKQ